MISVSGYVIHEKIHESASSLVFSGLRKADNSKVVLKQLRQSYPQRLEAYRLKQEFEILSELKTDGVPRALACVPHNKSWLTVMEPLPGIPLDQFLNNQAIHDLKFFLKLAIGLAKILGEIHKAFVIHKNICPANILYDEDSGKIGILDFRLSTRLSREVPSLVNPNVLEGTLPYIAPEQTGRMNRLIDYRSDWYSLGATFYHMLTGRPPFQSEDPMELIHAHLAVSPAPPHKLDADIPRALSKIILKLMAKPPEDRYQTAAGLTADLQHCLEAFNLKGRIEEFNLDQDWVSNHFQIPQRLYGRQEEAMVLMETFEAVAAGENHLLLVAGSPGVGKSSLIQEIHKPNLARKGYFVTGKFEQFKRDIPYSALIEAFRELIQQLLTESEEVIEDWQEKIRDCLKFNGKILTDVLPELELFIGPQPSVPFLSTTEAQNRFHLLFQDLVHLFTERCPLVLFLDDLQWSDVSSLKLIELFMKDTTSRRLLLICAYRDNEVDENHPFMLCVRNIEQLGLPVDHVKLDALKPQHVNEIVADTLGALPEEVERLAAHCYAKTLGNPFFLNQFLLTLHEKELIVFDEFKKCWVWDMERILRAPITKNVVDLMVSKISRLPSGTRQALMLAAFIGNQFELEVLALIYDKDEEETLKTIWPAQKERFVVARKNLYKFVHDRIQAAAYQLAEEGLRQSTHLKVGQIMLARLPAAKQEERFFEIVAHLNNGITLIDSREARLDLARRNLLAGRKAKASSAFDAAAAFLETGIALLPADNWANHYQLSLDLYGEAAEANVLSLNIPRMNDLAAIIRKNARDDLDLFKTYEVQIQGHIMQNQPKLAVDTGLAFLALMGETFPAEPNVDDIVRELHNIVARLEKISDEALLALPLMTDPRHLACIKIGVNITTAVFQVNPALMPLLVFNNLHKSLDHGNCNDTPISYAILGFIIIAMKDEVDMSYRLGKLALALVDRMGLQDVRGRTIFTVMSNILYRKEPVLNITEPLKEAYQYAVANGDFEFGCGALLVERYAHFVVGDIDLVELDSTLADRNRLTRKLNQEKVLEHFAIFRQAVSNFQGNCKNPAVLDGPHFALAEMTEHFRENNDNTAFSSLYTHQIMVAYHFGAYREAYAFACECAKRQAQETGLFVLEAVFYGALAGAALLNLVEADEREVILADVIERKDRLEKWAIDAPENFLHRATLVKGELARIGGELEAAIDYYDEAVKLASKHNFARDEALANERMAHLWIARKKTLLAQPYLNNACQFYHGWGAVGKVAFLQENFAQYIISEDVLSAGANSLMSLSYSGMLNEQLDLASVLKSTQAISREIVLSSLLEKLMRILMENAGAQRGFLLLHNNGEWMIRARGEVGLGEVYVPEPIRLQECDELSAAIVNYATKTRKDVVLVNASESGIFTSDPYVLRHRPKSVLCSPIDYHGRPTVALYLENNLNAGTFTIDRLKVLRLLTAQAAISLENASLYASLEQKVTERTVQLRRQTVQLVSSIQCAQRIQEAILPDVTHLKDTFPESFILFEPKAIVSGDFFWFSLLEDSMIVAAVDCTGHGVPGGFMSMIANTFLNRIVNEERILEPWSILEHLHLGVRQALKQDRGDGGAAEGMDIVICRIQRDRKQLSFAGARRPLYVVTPNEDGKGFRLIDHKGSRKSIGGRQREQKRTFKQVEIELGARDRLYLTSDGFIDQPDEKGRKYGTRRLKNFLTATADRDMASQFEALQAELKRQKGDRPQRDDIMILGISCSN